MWKKRGLLRNIVFCGFTGIVEKIHVLYTAGKTGCFPHQSFSFSTEEVEKCRLPFGVDIGFDLLHGFGERRFLFHFLFHLLDGIQHCGVVPVIELLADIV